MNYDVTLQITGLITISTIADSEDDAVEMAIDTLLLDNPDLQEFEISWIDVEEDEPESDED